MPNLDDAFYPALWDFARETAAPPEWYLDIFLLESGLNPASHRAGSNYFGLNQIGGKWLADHGIASADYLTWSASRQFETVVKPFYRDVLRNFLKKTPRSVGVLYALNLLPGRVLERGDTPDTVLTASPEKFYTDNPMDVNKDGKLTIDDLDRFLANKWNQMPQDVLRKLYAAGPSDWVPIDVSKGVTNVPPILEGTNTVDKSSLIATALAGIAVGLAAYVGYETLSKHPIRNPVHPRHRYGGDRRLVYSSTLASKYTFNGDTVDLEAFLRDNDARNGGTLSRRDLARARNLKPGARITYGGGAFSTDVLQRIS